MKRSILLINILIILTFFLYNIVKTKIEQQDEVHIYLDLATFPTLFQANDLMNRPKHVKKFIAWKRFQNLDKNFLESEYNATVLDFLEPEKTDIFFAHFDDSLLVQYFYSHPNSQAVIHVNQPNARYLMNNMENWIPIKEIHLYDDGMQFLNIIPIYENQQEAYFEQFLLYYKYPRKVYYHISEDLRFWSCNKNQNCRYLKEFLKHKKVRKITVQTLRKQLNSRKKIKEIFKILGYDYNKFKTNIVHPYVLFFLNLDTSKCQQIYIKRFIFGDLKNIIPGNVNWFYKKHPEDEIDKPFSSEYNFIKEIDHKLPAELLFISDLAPDYVVGFSSSIFFSIPPKKVMAYISENPRRYYDPYIELLKDYKIVNDNNIFYCNDN